MSDRKIIVGALVAFLVTSVVGLVHKIPDIEAELEQRTISDLESLGIDYEAVDFSGRIGTVTVAAGTDQATRTDIADRIEDQVGESFFNDVFRIDVKASTLDNLDSSASTTTAAPATTGAPATTAAPTTTAPATTAPATTAPTTTAPTTTDPPPAAAVETEIAELVALDGIGFASGGSNITAESQLVLDEVAAVLIANPDVAVQVEGHTDDQGSDSGNQALSEARATAVVDYLIGAGVESERLTPVGFGETQPIADNTTPEGRAANRRIEFIVSTRSN